uniref:Uncharacterized protein n=1 Tax=Glossina pallidipes TaxID=7398 RepID=A0A1B0AAQ6_GLOPL
MKGICECTVLATWLVVVRDEEKEKQIDFDVYHKLVLFANISHPPSINFRHVYISKVNIPDISFRRNRKSSSNSFFFLPALSLVLLFQFHAADKLSVVAGAIVDRSQRMYVQLDTIIEIFNNDLYSESVLVFA